MKNVVFVEGFGFFLNIGAKRIEFSETVDAACEIFRPMRTMADYVYERVPALRSRLVWPLRMMRPDEVRGPCYAFVEGLGFATRWNGRYFSSAMRWCQSPFHATFMRQEEFTRTFGRGRLRERTWGFLVEA